MRDAIQDALKTVELDPPLDPRAYQPDTLAQWQAWPVWVLTNWLNACVTQTTWQVLIVLPPGSNDVWIGVAEAVIEPVRTALEQVGHVESAEPVTLSVGDLAPALPALRFNLTTPGS